MKKMNELMSDLGFNAKASSSAKEAFLKHLIKTTTGAVYRTPTEKKSAGVFSLPCESQSPKFSSLAHSDPEQLCFDLDNCGESPGQRSA